MELFNLIANCLIGLPKQQTILPAVLDEIACAGAAQMDETFAAAAAAMKPTGQCLLPTMMMMMMA